MDAHKTDFGHVWVFGGSKGFTGAPRLAANGALAAGAGLVSLVCPDDVWPVVAASSLEVMVHPAGEQVHRADGWQADVVVAGPGWGKQHHAELAEIIALPQPLVLDADALNMLADDKTLQQALCQRKAITVLTPHPGEAGRLLGMKASDIQQDRKKSVLTLARQLNCWVVLKGHYSLIASPDGCVVLNPFGTSRLATAGSGDVLAGMIGASLARRYRRVTLHETSNADCGVSVSQQRDAIVAAVALHGQAGESADWYRAGQLVDVVAALRVTSELQIR